MIKISGEDELRRMNISTSFLCIRRFSKYYSILEKYQVLLFLPAEKN